MTLIDAGPLVAILDESDAHHAWATTSMRALQPPLLTCEAVISEACFLLGPLPRARKQIRLWAETGFLLHEPLIGTAFLRALGLMERYDNVPMSFADACLVAMAEQHESARVFTLDRDFLVYRRTHGQPVALLAPFAE